MQAKSSEIIADNFELITVRSLEEIRNIRSIWEKMQDSEPYPKINADIDRYLSLVEANGCDRQPYIMLIKEAGLTIGMLMGVIQKNEIKCSIGRKTLFKPTLRELCVVYGGVIGKQTREICRLIVHELIQVLRSGEVDMVSFNHLRTDSYIYKVAKQTPGLLCRDYFPKVEPHWTMSVAKNMDIFFQRFSTKHRHELRRCIRKLEKEYSGDVKVTTYRKESEVKDFVKAASEISCKTYQYAFGKGIEDNSRTIDLMTAAVKLGWFRAYILFIRNKPCAFLFGSKYQGVYYLDEIGYDPAWRQFSIGTVLYLKVFESICSESEVDTIDFGFGDAPYKHWYGNNHWLEASIYIVAPRILPVIVNLARSLCLAISAIVQYVIIKLGIFNSIVRYRRSVSLQKATRAKSNSGAADT